MAEENLKPKPKPVGVRNIETGQVLKREPVDCHEFVAHGLWEYVYELPPQGVAANEPPAPRGRGRRAA